MADNREGPLGRELAKLIENDFPYLREVRDSLAALAREEASNIQYKYRKAREDHQKNIKKGGAWVHDVRIKSIVSGAYVEWFAYIGRHGEQCYSEGIRSEGLLRIPASKFKKCSAAESRAIKDAEDAFEKVRQLCQHVSKISEALNSIPQMRLIGHHYKRERKRLKWEDIMRAENFSCNCDEPCTDCITH